MELQVSTLRTVETVTVTLSAFLHFLSKSLSLLTAHLLAVRYTIGSRGSHRHSVIFSPWPRHIEHSRGPDCRVAVRVLILTPSFCSSLSRSSPSRPSEVCLVVVYLYLVPDLSPDCISTLGDQYTSRSSPSRPTEIVFLL